MKERCQQAIVGNQAEREFKEQCWEPLVTARRSRCWSRGHGAKSSGSPSTSRVCRSIPGSKGPRPFRDRLAVSQAVVRLKVQQDYLDRAQGVFLSNMRALEQPVIKGCNTLYKQLNDKRCEESDQMNQTLFGIVQSLKQLKTDVVSEERLKTCDVDHYRKVVFDLENKITLFKKTSSQRNIELWMKPNPYYTRPGFKSRSPYHQQFSLVYAELMAEESSLTASLQGLERKLDEWSRPVSYNNLQPPPPLARVAPATITAANEDMAQEVVDFQNFLQETGGHTNGWEDQDHLQFLKIYRQHRGKPSLLQALASSLPHVSEDEIEAHNKWFQQYNALKQAQQRAINEWKKNKEKKKEEKIEPLELVENINKPEHFKTSPETKQKIADWKRSLHLQKELEYLHHLEEKEKEQMRQRSKTLLQARKKEEVLRYREEKWTKEQSALLARQRRELREVEERAARANVLIKVYREQDEVYVARQRFLKEHKESERLKQRTSSSQVERHRGLVQAERDPERLLQSTEVWKERCKKQDPVSRPLLHLRNMPRLSVGYATLEKRSQMTCGEEEKLLLYYIVRYCLFAQNKSQNKSQNILRDIKCSNVLSKQFLLQYHQELALADCAPRLAITPMPVDTLVEQLFCRKIEIHHHFDSCYMDTR
uniref:Coiled-coil domain-containing protein 112 n=1 Tax=Timema genevievae TaxID=629358 RepID=A0A7R9K1W0_TIMGE|nr:unnamed protein product [Timema genevievae]